MTCALSAPTATDVVTGAEWVSSDYTLRGGQTHTNIEPCYVRFGVGA